MRGGTDQPLHVVLGRGELEDGAAREQRRRQRGQPHFVVVLRKFLHDLRDKTDDEAST